MSSSLTHTLSSEAKQSATESSGTELIVVPYPTLSSGDSSTASTRAWQTFLDQLDYDERARLRWHIRGKIEEESYVVYDPTQHMIVLAGCYMPELQQIELFYRRTKKRREIALESGLSVARVEQAVVLLLQHYIDSVCAGVAFGVIACADTNQQLGAALVRAGFILPKGKRKLPLFNIEAELVRRAQVKQAERFSAWRVSDD